MNIDSLMALRPVDESAAAIRASRTAVAERCSELTETLNQCLAERGQLIVSGTKEEIKKSETVIHDAEASLAQLRSMMEVLDRNLIDAERSEKIASLLAQYEEIGADRATDQFSEAWRRDYAGAATVIVGLCEMEADALDRQGRADIIRKRLADLGVVAPARRNPCDVAATGIVAGYSSFGKMIRLPGLLGAPAIPTRTFTKKTIEQVRRPDWESAGGRDHTGKPIATKLVDETRTEIVTRVERDDKPFWWQP